jgi:hypothetical protein
MNSPKNRRRLTALASVPLLFLLSCSKQAVPPQTAASPPNSPPPSRDVVPAVDASTPKKASLAFAAAMVSGDTDKMRSVAVGTDSQVFVFYTALAEMVGAQRKFKAVLTAKFSDACKIPPEIDAIGNMNPIPPDNDSLTEKIDGDTAMLVDASGHPGLKFKKIGNAWKVDFDAADADLPAGGSGNMARQQEMFEATKKGFDIATDKIIDGSYTDCQAAIDDVMAAMPRP